MKMRVAVVGLFVSSGLNAQAPSVHRMHIGLRLPIGERGVASAQVCDGKVVESADMRRLIGKAFMYGGFGTVVIAPVAAAGGGGTVPVGVVELGALAWVGGWAVQRYSNPSEEFWQNTVSQVNPGQTTADDVRRCFHSPSSRIVSGTDETWTYKSASPGMPFGGKSRTVTIAFKNGVVQKVDKAESGTDER